MVCLEILPLPVEEDSSILNSDHMHQPRYYGTLEGACLEGQTPKCCYFVFYYPLDITSVCRFKSLSHYRHLAASQLSALQTMEMPLDGNKYNWLLNLQKLDIMYPFFYHDRCSNTDNLCYQVRIIKTRFRPHATTQIYGTLQGAYLEGQNQWFCDLFFIWISFLIFISIIFHYIY